ncbi:MAG: hypothetical protein COA80_03360 [Leeuwenhoekiella sp.]|nr:MAG: hypothetical protein COA80_03360 [Leeuwenhoekiella sp.]
MSEEKEIEKSIERQILDKTMEKLKQSELFPETLIDELKKIDLTNKESVKTAISAHEEDK